MDTFASFSSFERKARFGLMAGQRLCLALWLIACLATATGAPAPEERASLSLDGKWQGRMDPERVGEAQQWFSGLAPFRDQATVPGCWDSEGFGTEHEKARTNFTGRFWYKKTVRIPEDWQGQRIFLCIGGVHRTARTWVNDHYLGEHIGYLLTFEHDLTGLVKPGQDATIAMEVDSTHRPEIDPLHGACDIMDYMGSGYGKQEKESGGLNAGEKDVTWGGIWGHTRLEARSETWLADLFVQPQLSPPAVKVQARIEGDLARVGPGGVRIVVTDREGLRVVDRRYDLAKVLAGQGLALEAAIPDAKSWSFRSPYLYTVSLFLMTGEKSTDVASARVGLREIRIEGARFLLNGKVIFLTGYGDDSIYPETLGFPSDREVYLKRLRLAKSYGFNYVRHHSHMLPPEYYDACDEIGMLVSAEYPIAYGNRATTEAANANHRTIMRGTIRRHRNHPSIFNWCMGNEGGGDTLRKDFLKIVREEDPARPFIDTDGLWPGSLPNGENRDSLDFFVIQFDLMNFALDNPRMFAFDSTPVKPVVSHETGNFCTFPRFDQIQFFQGSLKPFWLTWGRDNYKELGLLEQADRFAYNSERLYALLHKINIEALRKNPRISGYHWWLLQDYWTTANGLVDLHFRQKAVWPDEVRQFNNDLVLLEDGLELAYRSGQALETRLQISNFGEDELVAETLSWRLQAGNVAVSQGTLREVQAAQANLTALGSVRAILPQVTQPERIVLEVEMSAGKHRIHNRWTSWVYPQRTAKPVSEVPIFASSTLLEELTQFGAVPLPTGTNLPAKAVYVAQRANSNLLNAVERGACLVLLSPKEGFVTEGTRFKQPWWHAQPATGLDEGTVVYDHPITRGLAPEGWLDAGFYRLIEGARGIRIENMPVKPSVLVRSIIEPRIPRNKALLFEGRAGNGSLLVSAFNHRKARGFPENDWLLTRLLDYAGTLPKPAVSIDLEALRKSVKTVNHPGGPYLQGFARIVTNEAETVLWHTALEDNVEGFVCRQTRPGNLITWETAPVPTEISTQIAFVFAGGLGWKSEPEAGGYVFLVNGKPALDFNFTMEAKSWSSSDGKIELRFRPTRLLPDDALGYFYVRLTPDIIVPGRPCILGVQSKGQRSKRWFGLHPYADLLD
jgi:hypothetical protein